MIHDREHESTATLSFWIDQVSNNNRDHDEMKNSVAGYSHFCCVVRIAIEPKN